MLDALDRPLIDLPKPHRHRQREVICDDTNI
jgi:hypothetical protein